MSASDAELDDIVMCHGMNTGKEGQWRPVVGPEPDAPFVIHNSYFGRERFEGVEERNGLQMHFAGWSQPLESYMLALEGAGFAISALREPIPDASDAWTHMEQWSRITLVLWLKARPLPGLGVPFRRGNS